jgi:hypothetical protein
MPDHGCCLAGGVGDGQDFTGFGCLYAHPGHYYSRVKGDGDSTSDLSASMATSITWATDSREKSIRNMCPVGDELLANMVEYEEKTEYPASRNGAIEQVKGGNGQYFAPQGLTGAAGETHISIPGTNVGDTVSLYVSQVVREVTLEYAGDEVFFGVNTARYEPNAKLLWATADGGFEANSANVDVGAMAPGTCGKDDDTAPCEGFNGAQHAGEASGTGLPVYLTQPMFLNADPDLLNNAVNNIDVYHCFEYVGHVDGGYEGLSSLPTAFDENGDWDLTKCEVVDAAFLAAHAEDLQVYILVEPGTGMAISGHKRLGLSMSPVTDCNPATDPTCALGVTATGALGACHGAVAGAFWDGIALPTGLTAGQTLATMYSAETAAYAPGAPCSQANVLTPAYKGGSLVPLWWVDQAADATEAGMDNSFVLLNKFLELCGTIQMGAIAAGAVFVVIGGACIAMGGGGGNKVTAAA